MNRKLSFLAVLTVIVAIFAMTTMVLADAPVVSRAVAGETEVNVGDVTVLNVTADTDVVWYKADTYAGEGYAEIDGDDDTTSLVVDTSEAGTFFYYAVDADGVKSNVVKLSIFEVVSKPIIYYFGDEANSTYIGGGANTNKMVEDEILGKQVMELTATTGDPGINFGFDKTSLNIDTDVYKYFVVKIRRMNYIDQSRGIQLFHRIYDTTGGVNGLGSAGFGTTAGHNTLGLANNGDWQRVGLYLPYSETADIYEGNRLDFLQPAVAGEETVRIDYAAFFTDVAQYNAFLASGEEVEQPELDSYNWEFANDNAFAVDFFANDVTVDENGVAFEANTDYVTALKSRDKFDLATYSVVKIFYNGLIGIRPATLTFTDGETVLLEETLEVGGSMLTVDLTDSDSWKGEFSELVLNTNRAVNIEAIAFFKNTRDAALYEAEYQPTECTCDDDCACKEDGGCEDCKCVKDAEFEDAIWWDFADTITYNSVQPDNATPKYVAVQFEKKDDEGGIITPAVDAHSVYTVVEDGDVTFTYNFQNMHYEHRMEEAEKTPFLTIGYNGTVSSERAYIEYTTDYSNTPVKAEFAIADYATTDEKGNTKIELDLSSLTSIKAIDSAADEEFRGKLESFEFGFIDAVAEETVELYYINFFEDLGMAQRFDGDVKISPTASITGSWKSKSVVKAEYVTVDDLDMTADKVEFSLEDYSRISRLTLNELKKNYASTKITVNGNGFRYEFMPNAVKSDLKTWYYDLDAHFEAGFSGDVYRETIKELVTEEVGTYLGGIHFVQKFVKDTSFPFNGKFIFEVGEELDGKYLDIMKYDPKTNTLSVTEHAPVKDGMLSITTLGGDIAIVDSGYQPSEEELARAAAIETLENTVWEAKIFDFNADGDSLAEYNVNNATVTTKNEGGISYKSAVSTTEGQRMEMVLTPAEKFEASEYPVLVVKYKTSSNLQGAVNNYVSTDYYAATAGTDKYNGYQWFQQASYYSATSIFTKTTKWATKIINYTDMASMKATGLPVSNEHVDGGGAANASAVAYPFKGTMDYYRLDFNVGPVGTEVDVAYFAFFKTEEEAKKYMEARNAVEEFLDADAKAAEEAAKAAMPDYIVFDFLDKNETMKYTLHGGSDSQPVKTETKQTAEGFWGKDADAEFNYTRSLSDEEIFSLKDYPVLKIKVKYSIAGASTQFYVWQDNQSGNPRAELVVDKANEWTTQTWDFSKIPLATGTWDGNLTAFRIDPMRGAGSVEREATIEYIGFFKSVEAADAFTSVADAKAAEKEAAKKK